MGSYVELPRSLQRQGLINIKNTDHSVSSGVFYEGANFMINGLPEISISFFSELASIIYSLGFHNLFVNIISIWKQNYTRDQLHYCTGGFVTSWVLTKLTWPSLVELLNKNFLVHLLL